MTVPIGPVPAVSWRKIAYRLRQVWDPTETGAHIAIYGATRNGKTYLITRLILPLCHWSRVLIIDAKGHDKVWRGIGLEVAELPADLRGGGGGPCGLWWRLVANTDEDPDGATAAVAAALRRVAREGRFVVIIDEGLDLAGVRSAVNKLLTKGGSHGVSVVISATSTEHAPEQMHRQWAIMLAGQMPDARSHERVAEIAAMEPRAAMRRVIGRIPRQTFLYVDRAGEVGGQDVPVPMLGLTQAPAPEAVAAGLAS
jgi:hypothetical protein